MLWAAMAYCLGVTAGVYLWRPVLWWVIAATAFLSAAAYFTPRRSRPGWTLALGAFFFVGALHAQLRGGSPRLDTSILELDSYPNSVEPVPFARSIPAKPLRNERAYLIGHPGAASQPQFSLQDNILLDYDHRLLHYRAPSEPGSSGSPIFDHHWQLMGLHHAGGHDIPRLNSTGGTYAANEGIRLDAIIARLHAHPPGR